MVNNLNANPKRQENIPAQDNETTSRQIPRVGFGNHRTIGDGTAEDQLRVILRFRNTFLDHELSDFGSLHYSALLKYDYSLYLNEKERMAFTNEFSTLKIERLFITVTPEAIFSLSKTIKSRKGDFKAILDLLTYFTIVCTTEAQASAVVKLIKQFSTVEFAEVDGTLATAAAQIDPSSNGAWGMAETAFLREAPGGINAKYAWSIEKSHGIKGGDGGGKLAGLKFVDIEHGWLLTDGQTVPQNHGDIQQVIGIDGQNRAPLGHGTACLGIVIASDEEPPNPADQPSSLGITPNVDSIFCVSTYRTMGATQRNLYDALLYAINYRLDTGDVLLVEVYYQLFPRINPRYYGIPVEINPIIFTLIKGGTDKGITIIEPAGNTDRDNDLDTLGIPRLTRGSGIDSGAILVSAASSSVPRTGKYPNAPLRFNQSGPRMHSFGSRVDCFAWGEDIYTTWHAPGDPPYCYFADTSGAAAIIAGAALSVQGLAKINLGRPFAPLELRDILSNADPNTGGGTLSHDPPNDKIGVMPDLKNIICNRLRLTPQSSFPDSSAPAPPINLVVR